MGLFTKNVFGSKINKKLEKNLSSNSNSNDRDSLTERIYRNTGDEKLANAIDQQNEELREAAKKIVNTGDGLELKKVLNKQYETFGNVSFQQFQQDRFDPSFDPNATGDSSQKVQDLINPLPSLSPNVSNPFKGFNQNFDNTTESFQNLSKTIQNLSKGNLFPDPLAGIRKMILVLGGLFLGYMAIKELRGRKK